VVDKKLHSVYPVGSLEYRIIYYALCDLALDWHNDDRDAIEIAQIHGMSVSDVHQTLEALYTDNPDPDTEVLDEEAEE
jgi:hypothetical protein